MKIARLLRGAISLQEPYARSFHATTGRSQDQNRIEAEPEWLAIIPDHPGVLNMRMEVRS